MKSFEQRLEQYTILHPQEVLLVTIDVEGEEDYLAVFKGFASSLMKPTAFDPDVSVLPENATIITIDRVQSPYNPDNPQYIQQGLTCKDMETLLSNSNL